MTAPPGERCSAPEILNASPGAQSTANHFNDSQPSAACGVSAGTVPDRVYRVTLLPDESMVATVMPSGNWNPLIYLLPSLAICGTSGALPACLASSDAPAGAGENLIYRNTANQPQEVLLVVDGATPADFGNFTLSLAFVPPTCGDGIINLGETCDDGGGVNGDGCSAACTIEPGARCTGAPSVCSVIARPTSSLCADVSTGTPLLTNVDDAVSPNLPLPFTVSLYGNHLQRYAVSSNGFMALLANSTETINPTINNAQLPSVTAPNGMLAPFWDDLNRMTVRVLTGGLAPSAQVFVVDWSGGIWTSQANTSEVHFQVQFSQATGAMEFIYCDASPGNLLDGISRIGGSGATIGVENLTGTDGFMMRFNNVVTTWTATWPSAWRWNVP